MMTEPKKRVDEEWKAEVEREKARLQAESAKDKPKAEHPPLPEPSFPLLISEYATRTFLALGRIPNPTTQKAEQDLDQARYTIGMLEVIQEKTKGNLTDQENQILEDVLYQVRMQYVDASKEGKREKA